MTACVQCGGPPMQGRRRCALCWNAQRRAQYGSAQPKARREGKRTSATREPGRHWCWWCQETHPRQAFPRHRGRPSGVGTCCLDGMRTLYRLRTLGTRRVPARGRRTAREETP